MNLRPFIGFVTFLISFSAFAQSKENTKATLAKLARARSVALIAGNSVRMKEILDEGFFYVNSEGEKKNRQEYLKNMYLSGDSKWLSQEIKDLDITLLGTDAAILSLIVLDQFRYEGKNYSVTNRSTFVYARKEKTWKCMAGHTTEIGEKQ